MKSWRRFFNHRRSWLGTLMIGSMLILAIATPSLAPQKDPANPEYFLQIGLGTDSTPRSPSNNALLGTLPGQYDILYTLLWGLRQAFKFGLSVTLITGAFGIFYGASSAYLGGRTNNLLMRITDAFLAIPVLAAIVFIIQIIANVMVSSSSYYSTNQVGNYYLDIFTFQEFLKNTDPVMWALILLSWMPYARLVNASVLRLRNVDYVLSARALGAGHARIIFRHLLPNVLSPEIVLAARDVGGMVILQATFTFIGMGGKSPWGQLLGIARNWIVGPGGNPLVYWWTYVPVTLALIFFSLGWNFLGDSLNEWLNPRKLSQ